MGLWSHSPDITAEINDSGQYKGWENVKRYYHFPYHYSAYGGLEKAPPEYLHIGMPIAGIVDLDPDGKTAKGKWYGFFLVAQPRGGKFGVFIGCGIWENEFMKEEGIWKLKKVFWNDIFSSPYDEGWVKTPLLENLSPRKHLLQDRILISHLSLGLYFPIPLQKSSYRKIEHLSPNVYYSDINFIVAINVNFFQMK